MELTYDEIEQVRIDTWLTRKFPYSRAFFHHIIQRWGVQVNWNAVKKSLKLKLWDHISVDSLERYLSPVILEEAPDIDIQIMLEKDDYLIINKPKWVLSHPNSLRDVKEPSVVGRLYHHFKNLPSFSNFIRAGLVHRLDKETDWLMIIAKTERGLAHFKQLFSEKSESETIAQKENVKLQKYYRAKCEILPDGDCFLQEIKKNWLPFYIQETVYAKTPHFTPKLGITKIEKIAAVEKNRCEVQIQLLTGRTHQIRYHLSHHGLPLVGDYLYGHEDVESMQLTAYRLLFQDPDGEMMNIYLNLRLF